MRPFYRQISLAALLLVGLVAPLRSQDAASSVRPKIINGLTTTDYPAVAELADPWYQNCSATLIGCSTVLTAAHCVCDGDGTTCQPGGFDLDAPEDLRVHLQHAGPHAVASVHVPTTYEFGERDDVAILKLVEPVTTIEPARINDIAEPTPGMPGIIVGFGYTVSFNFGLYDNGIKRKGKIVAAPCEAVPDATHVCWKFELPEGEPGEDSNTCYGDSGGPLIMDFGGDLRLAGVTSGGTNSMCWVGGDNFDTSVYSVRQWIRQVAGDDLGTTCGDLPPLDHPSVEIFTVESRFIFEDQLWDFEVPPGTELLRFNMNGMDAQLGVNLKVAANRDPQFTHLSDCFDISPGSIETCEIEDPEPGIWTARISGDGVGDYQLVVTSYTDRLFADGFESGDVTIWSSFAP